MDKKKYKGLLILFAFIYIISGCKKDSEVVIQDPNQIDFSFFVAGHTYGNPRAESIIGVHPPFKDKFDLIRNDEFIQFGVFTGDIVPYGTEDDWNAIDKDILELNKTVYFAVGNHDMRNRELFESRYGETYKSFIYNSNLFIILDPNIDGWNISGDQLKFLKDELTNNHKNVDNIFVFFHQLLWWEPDNIYKNVIINSGEGRAETINFWSEVEPLFTALPNEVYMFAGDVGAFPKESEFMYHNYDNITLIASGMGGEVRDNFVIIDIKKNKTVNFRLIALNGDDINALGKLEDYVLK